MKSNKIFYNLVISSNSLISGSVYNGSFLIQLANNNNKPIDTSTQYQIAISEFVCTNFPIMMINIPSTSLLNSYNTLTSGIFNLLTIGSHINYFRDIQHNSMGNLLSNIQFFYNSVINIQFTDAEDNILITTTVDQWVMTLFIWEVDTEEINKLV